MKKGVFGGIIILGIVPVLINYGLLTWSAPGIQADTNAWLGFLGSYLGFIGAISIALYQNKKQREADQEQERKQKIKERAQEQKQKEKERQQDLESKRSYVVVIDFETSLGLKNVKMHEDSRLLETEGYNELVKIVQKTPYLQASCTYLNITQYGNSPVVLDGKLVVHYEEGEQPLEFNFGVLQQGIEVFIPIAPKGLKSGESINIQSILITYITLSGEKMKYHIDHIHDVEYYSYLNNKGEEVRLYEGKINSAKWTYPNKLKETINN